MPRRTTTRPSAPRQAAHKGPSRRCHPDRRSHVVTVAFAHNVTGHLGGPSSALGVLSLPRVPSGVAFGSAAALVVDENLQGQNTAVHDSAIRMGKLLRSCSRGGGCLV